MRNFECVKFCFRFCRMLKQGVLMIISLIPPTKEIDISIIVVETLNKKETGHTHSIQSISTSFWWIHTPIVWYNVRDMHVSNGDIHFCDCKFFALFPYVYLIIYFSMFCQTTTQCDSHSEQINKKYNKYIIYLFIETAVAVVVFLQHTFLTTYTLCILLCNKTHHLYLLSDLEF